MRELHDRLLRWAQQAQASGWLEGGQWKTLLAKELASGDDLFINRAQRPLLIGLFGGTGVGKSSLLNRLAGETIARTGIQRPTSREVTLYLHSDFPLNELPPALPVEQTQVAYHHQASRRQLAWLDMPDMDSTEQSHRQLVEHWIPYLDWVVYVVTPERYFDAKGWRVLQQRRQRHGWMFVMNHWDQGQQEQFEDFKRLLVEEGFLDAMVLRTSCQAGHGADDFPLLEQQIGDAIERHGLKALQSVGRNALALDLSHAVEQLRNGLGTRDQWQREEKICVQLQNGSLHQLKAEMVSHLRVLLAKLDGRLAREAVGAQGEEMIARVWGERECSQITLLDQQIINQLRLDALPAGMIEQLMKQRASSTTQFHEMFHQALDYSIAHPGGWLQRMLWRTMARLKELLPLLAGGWVAKHLLWSYHVGSQGMGPFLGADFMLHSAGLITLAWLIPWWLQRVLEPTPLAILWRGLQDGIGRCLLQVAQGYQQVWRDLEQQHAELCRDLAEISAPLMAKGRDHRT